MVKTAPIAFACRSRPTSAGFVLGRERFARISAVKGVVLTPAMRADLERFDREGQSAAALFSPGLRRRLDRPDVRKRARSLLLSRYRNLRGRLGPCGQARLDAYEAMITAQRIAAAARPAQ
jgi:hypothetical protein